MRPLIRSSNPWSPEEDAILTNLFPIGGAYACAPYLRPRTLVAIRSRAKTLKVRCQMVPKAGARTETHFTHAQVEACRLLASWRGPVNKGVLRWAA